MSAYFRTLVDCSNFASTTFSTQNPLLSKNHQSFDPVSVAAILAFSFTLIHPLIDGNGRTHRLLLHYLLEQYDVLDSWLVPVSVIILHDNIKYGSYDKVLRSFSEPVLRRTRHHFDQANEIHVDNRTDTFFQTWDASEIVDYFYGVLQKAAKLSVDCALYIKIWDECSLRLHRRKSLMSKSTLRMIIGRYLHAGLISKNTRKTLTKTGVSENDVAVVTDVCEELLKDDPSAFTEEFAPFSMTSAKELEQASAGAFVDETGYDSV